MNTPFDAESSLHSLEIRYYLASDATCTENVAVHVSPDSQIVDAAAIGL